MCAQVKTASKTTPAGILKATHCRKGKTMTVPGQKLTARFVLFFALISIMATTGAAGAERSLEADVDSFMKNLMENLDVVPGYSIAVVTPGSTVFAKGYGTTVEPGGQPMDANTQVYIASSSKSLTGLAAASLARKGLIDLDIPIDHYVADLEGSNAGRVTLRQLLSHTHGLVEEALTWRTAYSGQYTRDTLLLIVKEMLLSETPGEFDYSNTGYLIASLVLEEHFGKSWKDIVTEEVLMPAGMDSTTAYVSALQNDYAQPHSWYGVKNNFPLSKQDNTMHAAGGHFSTANDMAKWLQAQLSDGRINGRQVYAPGLVESTHSPNTTLDAEFYTYRRHHYGIGWYQAEYKGYLMYHHFGSYAGYRSHVSFIPELKTGVAVLINDASRPGLNLPDLVANYIYDLAAGTEFPEAGPRAEIAEIAGMIKPMAGRTPPERSRGAPDHEDRYAGSYQNEEFGTIAFAMVEGELMATFGNLSSRTTYKEDGAIRMELSPYEGTLGTFLEGEDGNVTGFQYRGAYYHRL
jgi:CubicO group peptidase (beta-lactamase class C family)